MSVSAERLAAAHLLIRVEDGAYASRLLARMRGSGVRARVLGVLRWQRLLDHLLDRFSRRPVARLETEVRAVLRIGLFEATHLGVPRAVATDAAVRLARRLGRSSAAGLVNAVLRRAVAVPAAERERLPADLRWSHPGWLARRWRARFGDEATMEIMAASQEPATLWARSMDAEGEDVGGDPGFETMGHPWCPGAWTSDAGAVLARVAAGRAYIQDPSSQVVGLMAGGLVPGGGRIVDMCAAPGGKTSQLAGRGPWADAVALDRSIGRVRLMKGLLASLPRRIPVVAADATRPPLAAQSFDFVLLDAPCSGTGTLRRHPELKWRLDEKAVLELTSIQARLLAAGLELVAEGGVLLYSTCSIEAEENEDHFRAGFPGFGRHALESLAPERAPVLPTPSGGIRLLPAADADGFTLHALRRKV